DACLEARECGIDGAIFCSVDEAVDAGVAAALSFCLCALLEACLGRPDPTGASFRVLRQEGRLRLVALLPAAIDPCAALAVADGLAAVRREADDQTLILKYDFAEVL